MFIQINLVIISAVKIAVNPFGDTTLRVIFQITKIDCSPVNY